MSPTPRLTTLVRKFEREYNSFPGLLSAIISRESDWDPDAIGAAGEFGLAQLLGSGAIASWELFNAPLADYLDPVNNLRVAAWYLGHRIPELLTHYDLPVTLANIIICYNAGISRAISGDVPSLTLEYIEEIKVSLASSPSLLRLLLAGLLAGTIILSAS